MSSQLPPVTESQLPESQLPESQPPAAVDHKQTAPAKDETKEYDAFPPARLHALMASLKRRPRTRAANMLFEDLCRVLAPDQATDGCPDLESHYTDVARWDEGPEDEPYALTSTCFHTSDTPHHRRTRHFLLPVNVPPAAVGWLADAEERVADHQFDLDRAIARRNAKRHRRS